MTSPGGKEVGRISIRCVPDTSRFRRELEAQLKVIEDSVRATIQVDANLDATGAKAHMRALMAELKAQAAGGVDVKVGVDKSLLSSFTQAGSNAGSAAGGLGGMSRGLAIVAAVAAFAAPALALISGVLVTLPALITAVLVPIGAIVLGLDGLKKAAEVLKDPLDGLKKTMSQAFQDKFTPIFTKLKDLFPVLNQEMPKIANGLGDMASAFVNSVTSAPGMDAIRNTISNIGKALSDSAPGIKNFTDGLLKLISSVSDKLPNLSKIFNGWGDSFTNWVNKITTPSWFDGKTPLDKGLKSFKDTLVEILNIVGDLASKGFDFLSDPKFGQKMKDFVTDVKDLVNNVLPGLGQFFQDLTGVLTDMSNAAKEVKDNVPDFVKREIPAAAPKNKDGSAKDLNNIFEPFTSPDAPWRTMWADIDKAAAATASWIETTWGQLTGFFAQQGSAIAAGWSANWEIVKSAFSAVVSWFGTTWGQLTGSLSQTWSTVVSAAQTAASSIVGFFTGIPGALSSAWASLGSIASTAWNAVVSAVSTAMSGAVTAVVNGAAQVVAAVVGLGAKVVAACSNFGGLLVGAGAALIQGLINGIGSLAGAAIAKAKQIAVDVANAVKGALGIRSPSTVFTDIGSQTMQGLQNGLEGGFQGVLDRAKALTQQLTDTINGGLTGVDGKALSEQLKQQMAEIGLQSDELKIQLNNTTDKGQKDAIRGQRKQLQDVRDQLNLQQDQLGFSQKYGDQLDKNSNTTGETLNKMLEAGKGFATANISQFASDIGISGNGALSQAVDQGLGFGMQMLSKLISGGAGTNIHVNSVDEALAAKTNITNKAALQYRQR